MPPRFGVSAGAGPAPIATAAMRQAANPNSSEAGLKSGLRFEGGRVRYYASNPRAVIPPRPRRGDGNLKGRSSPGFVSISRTRDAITIERGEGGDREQRYLSDLRRALCAPSAHGARQFLRRRPA